MKWGLLTGIGLGTLVGLIYAQQRRSTTLSNNTRQSASTLPSAAARRGFRVGISNTNTKTSSGPGSHSFLAIINEWPHNRLIAIDGIGPVLATKIISHRPYRTPQELIDAKLLPPSAIEALRQAS